MPVTDTELLFALNPMDPKNSMALRLIRRSEGLLAPDTALMEFPAVLRGRKEGRTPSHVKAGVLALNEALAQLGVREVNTISTELLALQADIETNYGLSDFDSLISASTLVLDAVIISDDPAFDGVPNLERTPITG